MKYNIILDGKNEFYPNLNNKKYNILSADSKEKINFMINFFLNFIKNQNNNINLKHYIGCDFEFNRVRKTERDVALFQINMEIENENFGTIFVFYPPELNIDQTNILIKLLTNKYIIKILHGGESLDIPYLFDQLLKTKDNIINFCYNLFDTKYLCEYGHIESNSNIVKCSIYYLLEEYKIITSKKFKDLESIEEKTGPIYLIDINIHKLSYNVLRYSLYDVLFLPELIKKFISKGEMYNKVIPEITKLVFQYKRIGDHDINKIKKEVIRLNNNFLKSGPILNDIYNYYILTLYNKKINNLLKITYFREFFEICLKYVVYKYITSNMDVYENKNKLISPFFQYNFNKYSVLKDILDSFEKELY
jgi:hypothetical protein